MKPYMVVWNIDMPCADVEHAMITWAVDYPNSPIDDHMSLAAVQQYLIRTGQTPDATYA